MTDRRIHLLLIDDEPDYRREMVLGLGEFFEVDEAADGRAALDLVARNNGAYDVALIDQHLGSDPDGIAVLSQIRQTYPDIEGIVLTGYDIEDRERAVAAGAFGYVSKETVTEPELVQLISNAPEQARLRALSRDIFSRLESEEAVCRRILSATASHLKADNAAITLYNAATDRWRAYYLDAPADDAHHPLANRPLAEAIRVGGRPVWQAGLDEAQDDRLAALGLASLAAAPITGQAGFMGALIVYSCQQNYFNSDRPTGLQTLATWAGPALDNAQAYFKIKDQASDLQTLQILAREIASSLDMETVGNQTCAAAVKFFNAAHSGLLQFDEHDDYGVVTAEFPPGRGALGDRVPLRNVPDEQALILRRQPLRVSSVAQRETLGLVRDMLLGHDIRATLIVPVLAAEDRLLGSFSIDFDEERPFSDEDETYALMFASWAAIALDHARVYRESEAMTRQLDSLERAARQLRETDDPQKFHHQIVRGALEVMGCSAGCLILNHPDQRSLELLAHVGLEKPPDVLYWPYGLSLVGQVARNGRVVRCSTYDDTLEADLPLRHYGYRAAIAAPLLIMDEVRAILLLLDKEPRLCDSTHESILSRYVDQAAGTLRTSQAMTMSQRSIDQLVLLHRINDEIRDAADLRDTLHMVLTAVTANFGQQLNCAALWLLDTEDPADPALLGHTGIGYFKRVEAEATYAIIQREARATFAHYYEDLKAGRFRSERTPIDEAVRDRRVPLADHDWLRAQMAKPEIVQMDEMDAHRLPPALREAYHPGFPLLLAPLVVHDRPIGLLMADNRIIGAPLSEEARKGLRGLADAAAVAISNDRLRAERERQVAELRRRDEQRERVWRSSTAVAAAVVQEELEATLFAIADGVAASVGAETVTVYAYDAATRRFTHSGYHVDDQRRPGSVCLPQNVPNGSLLYQIVALREAPYLLLHDETRPNPALMQGRFVFEEGIQAAVARQLRWRGECVGVMFVNYRVMHNFNEHELDSIRSFANQAAAAIYGQKQYRTATSGNRQLEALHSAALSIGDARSLDDTLNEIARQALVVVGATNQHAACHLALLHGNSLQFRAASSSETLQRLRDEVGVMRLDAPKRPSIIARVARKGESENLPNAPADPDYWPFEPHTQSQLAVVIARRGAVIGVINLEHPHPAHFTTEHQAAMERLAALAAVSIQAAEDREQREIVARISGKVNSCRTLDEFLQAIYDELDVIFQRHEIRIRLALGHHEPKSAKLRMRRIPLPPGEGRPFIALDDPGVVSRVAATRRPGYIADVSQVTDPSEYYPLWLDTASEFAVPVTYEGDLLAVLDVQSTARDAFTAEDQNLIETLAEQVATTMHNVSRNEQLLSTQRAVDARTMLIYTTVATHRWGHRIHNQAQNIKEAVRLIERDRSIPLIGHPRLARRLRTISEQAEDIQRKPVKEPLHSERGVSLLPANVLLQAKVARVLRDWSVEDQLASALLTWSLEAQEEDHIAVNPDYFEMVVETILDNADRHGRSQSHLHIDIGTRRVGHQVEISFADNGPGIPAEIQAQLREGPVNLDEDKPGLGIGLFLARLVMKTYSGAIQYKDGNPQGATVILSFPLKPPPANAEAGGNP
jgi:GAF domain-containing protein/anti-sigma regulatory factor (Ser/Thr protein kinase)